MFRAWIAKLVQLLGVAVALAWLLPATARAEVGVVGRPLSVCVLAAKPGDDAARLIRQPERFDCSTPQRRLPPGDYWAISGPLDAEGKPPLRARIASLWQEELGFHVLYADGLVTSEHSDNRGLSRHIQLGAIVEHAVPLRVPHVKRLMWHVKGSANMRGILVGPRLADTRESARSNLAMGGIYAAFGGLGVALLVYNLALWGALRHRFQLYYCAMVAALLAYTFSSSGALAWVWPEIANNDRLRLNYLLLGCSGGAALLFARSFFEAHVFAGRMGEAITLTAWMQIGAGATFFLLAPFAVHLADTIVAYSFFAVLLAVPAMTWTAWRRRSNFLWLFAIAWGTPLLAASLRLAHNRGLLPWSFWLDNSTILAMAVEALVSSLAIAYRIRILTRERDQARAGETVARRLAETDPLTGLLNRRAFLDHAIGRAGAQTLVIIDIDHFKRVNDTIGHDGGDEVLRVFARALRASVEAGALVARLGGEEFAIVTDADTPVAPDALLDRLRATRMPFDLSVTASIGSSTGPLACETDWKALYRGADAALFAAKSAGRDRARAA